MVVRCRGGADLLTVWLLTVILVWLVRISLCVSALDTRQIKISTIADRQTLVELGFGFSFPFILKNCSSANFAPKSGVTVRGLRPSRRNFTCFKDSPWETDSVLLLLSLTFDLQYFDQYSCHLTVFKWCTIILSASATRTWMNVESKYFSFTCAVWKNKKKKKRVDELDLWSKPDQVKNYLLRRQKRLKHWATTLSNVQM